MIGKSKKTDLKENIKEFNDHLGHYRVVYSPSIFITFMDKPIKNKPPTPTKGRKPRTRSFTRPLTLLSNGKN